MLWQQKPFFSSEKLRPSSGVFHNSVPEKHFKFYTKKFIKKQRRKTNKIWLKTARLDNQIYSTDKPKKTHLIKNLLTIYHLTNKRICKQSNNISKKKSKLIRTFNNSDINSFTFFGGIIYELSKIFDRFNYNVKVNMKFRKITD